MYKAVRYFVDGENGRAWPKNKGGAVYAAGDPYPKEGFKPTKKHIEYLLGQGNRFGRPVIVDTDKVDHSQPAPEGELENAEAGNAETPEAPPVADG